MPTTGQSIVNEMLPQMLPGAAPWLAGVALALWLLGRASLRLLQDTHEDIPHRGQMAWGGRWYWAVITGLLMVPLATVYAAALWNYYPLSALMLAGAGTGTGVLLAELLLPRQSEGAFLWLIARKRQEGETLLEMIERHRTQPAVLWGRRLGALVLALPLATAVWILSTTVPLEQDLARFEYADSLGTELVARLQSPSVEKAIVMFDGHVFEAGSGNRVHIVTVDGTSEETLQSLADAASEHVPEIMPAGEWTIRVRVEGRRSAERTLTVPER